MLSDNEAPCGWNCSPQLPPATFRETIRTVEEEQASASPDTDEDRIELHRSHRYGAVCKHSVNLLASCPQSFGQFQQ